MLFEAIEEVTPREVAEMFGMKIHRDRMVCPWHGEGSHGESLVIKRDGKVCYCYSCSRGWNALQLYQKLTGIDDSTEAAKALAKGFGINVDDVSAEAIEQARAARDERRRRHERAEHAKRVFGRILDELRDEEFACMNALNRHKLDPNDERHVDAAYTVVERLGIAQTMIENLMAVQPQSDDDFIEWLDGIERGGEWIGIIRDSR